MEFVDDLIKENSEYEPKGSITEQIQKRNSSDKPYTANRRLTSKEKFEMGETQLVTSRKDSKEASLKDFEHKLVIGRGSYGKVILSTFNGKEYAIKVLRKDRLIAEYQVENVKLERDVLFGLTHPFLVDMEYLFMDDLRLYFVMPFIKGAELYTIYTKRERFNLEEVRFFAAQVVLALGYLHENKIAHRDLKLENLLLDQDGYLKLIDFGLAK